MPKSEEQERLEQEIVDKVLAYVEADHEASTIVKLMLKEKIYTGPLVEKEEDAEKRRETARCDFTKAAGQLKKLRELSESCEVPPS